MSYHGGGNEPIERFYVITVVAKRFGLEQSSRVVDARDEVTDLHFTAR